MISCRMKRTASEATWRESGLNMHDDRLRALETDAEDDASSVYVSDEDSGGSTY